MNLPAFMKFKVTCPSDPKLDTILAALAKVQSTVDQLVAQGGTTRMTLDDLKAKLQADNDALVAAVTRATTVEQSVETLLNGQAAQLAALRQQVTDLQNTAGIDDATIQPILDSIDAQIAAGGSVSDKLTAAVTANTPATT